jgi:hypothetical protein
MASARCSVPKISNRAGFASWRAMSKGHFSYFILEADEPQAIGKLFHPMQP